MKIKSNLSINFFTIYGEAKGIARNKKRIIKSRKKRYMNYYLELIIKFLALMVIGYYFLYSKDQLVSLFAFVFLVATVSVFIVKVLSIIRIYEHRYKTSFITSITIDERGIIDESFYGIKMLFKWNKIKGVVIGKKCITILTDTPVYFYFNKRDYDKIIKAIERYHKSTLIIK